MDEDVKVEVAFLESLVDQMIERLTRPVPFIQQLKDMATSGRKVHNEGEKA